MLQESGEAGHKRRSIMPRDMDRLLLWIQQLATEMGVDLTEIEVRHMKPTDTELVVGFIQHEEGRTTTRGIDRLATYPSKDWEEAGASTSQRTDNLTQWVQDAPKEPTFYRFWTTEKVGGYESAPSYSIVVVVPTLALAATEDTSPAAVSVEAQLVELGLSPAQIKNILDVTPVHLARDAASLGIAASRVENPGGSAGKLRVVRKKTQAKEKKRLLQSMFGFVGTADTCEEINAIIDGAAKYLQSLGRPRR